MLTDEFTHEIGKAFKVQTDALLAKQSAVAAGSFQRRTGNLQASFSGASTVQGPSARLSYPKYIRFLDMKRGKGGVRKKHAPIYNRPVYGYLVGGIRRYLNAVIPGILVKTMNDTFKNVKQ